MYKKTDKGQFSGVMFVLAITVCSLVSGTFGSGDFTSEQCDGDHFSVNCRSRKEMADMIEVLREEARTAHHLINENCTVCWNGPCKNGGECVPLSETDYRCECPPNYTGRNCEVLIECKPDSCGKNADCFVNHHMIVCVCQFGFTGDPFKNCTMKTMIAGMAGDPHYKTFDDQRYDYMGTCPYFFILPCMGDSFPEPFGKFWVKVRNELSYPNAHVSTASEFEVHVHGHTFHVDNRFNLYKDGVRIPMPYSYPNCKNSELSFTFKNSHLTVHHVSMTRIYFSYGMLYVEMPDVAELRGPDIICGLAGNRDLNCSNDFRTRDGLFYKPVNDSCNNRGQFFTEEYGDTYITSDFLNVNIEDDADCLKGTVVANVTRKCDLQEAMKLCSPIQEALNASGPFGACKGVGAKVIDDFFQSCVFDVCQRNGLICTMFSAFATTCQLRLPNTSLKWRADVGCPNIHCPLHSKYSSCASACPPTCANPKPANFCTETCMEGCQCDPGYLLDESDSVNFRCVPPYECGCKDDDGNYHPASSESYGNYWMTDNCTVLNTCDGSAYHKKAVNCSENSYCGPDHHFHLRCRCNTGYKGDGFFCEDINECEDPRTCNADKGQGECYNTPGSYYCTCDDFYEGENCELYRPRRHCGDLYVHHGHREDGVYIIKLLEKEGDNVSLHSVAVFCDMHTEENGHRGGWTLMADTYDSTVGKTYQEYVVGFGEVMDGDVWLGLENLHTMTSETNMSLRVNLRYCNTSRKQEAWTYCTYSYFLVLDAGTGYAVEVPEDCHGNDSTYLDGWVRWTNDTGPSFYAIDTDPSNCSEYFYATGWWFDHTQRCGAANLNGRRYSCSYPPHVDQLGHYLTWNNNAVSSARLLLRPTDYPNYDAKSGSAKPTRASALLPVPIPAITPDTDDAQPTALGSDSTGSNAGNPEFMGGGGGGGRLAVLTEIFGELREVSDNSKHMGSGDA